MRWIYECKMYVPSEPDIDKLMITKGEFIKSLKTWATDAFFGEDCFPTVGLWITEESGHGEDGKVFDCWDITFTVNNAPSRTEWTAALEACVKEAIMEIFDEYIEGSHKKFEKIED